MSSKDLLSPYINRFKPINQQMSYVRLELCCKDQKVTVNFMIWESFLEKTGDSDVLKKNISTPLFATIERRSETRADEARLETEQQQMQILRLKKHPLIMKKPHLRPKKPIIMLKKLRIL